MYWSGQVAVPALGTRWGFPITVAFPVICPEAPSLDLFFPGIMSLGTEQAALQVGSPGCMRLSFLETGDFLTLPGYLRLG